jgi:hypothetical protein
VRAPAAPRAAAPVAAAAPRPAAGPVIAAAPAPRPAAPTAVAAPPAPRAPARGAPAEAPQAAPVSNDPLERLMSASVTKGGRKGEVERQLAAAPAAEPAPAPKVVEPAEAPQPLSRAQIQDVMKGVVAEARECYQRFRQEAQVDVKLTVTPQGGVSAVSVSGPFAGTPTGACVESLVRVARFPASAGLRFDYRIPVRY